MPRSNAPKPNRRRMRRFGNAIAKPFAAGYRFITKKIQKWDGRLSEKEMKQARDSQVDHITHVWNPCGQANLHIEKVMEIKDPKLRAKKIKFLCRHAPELAKSKLTKVTIVYGENGVISNATIAIKTEYGEDTIEIFFNDKGEFEGKRLS